MTRSRTASAPTILAAGVVAFRPGHEVLLVHRPGYDDWSFPKGKLESGEHACAAAVRETAEETGLHVRLGPPLPAQSFSRGRRMKTVSYWTARVVGDDDVSSFRPNDEIDEVAWVAIDKAASLLTYPMDRETLDAGLRVRRKSRALIVQRHAAARSRGSWREDDTQRPLLKAGFAAAERLVPVLAAYDVTRIVTSTSLRCRQTVAPYAETTGWQVDARRRLSEEDATSDGVDRIVTEVMERKQGAVICTHRPVLPSVYDALDLRPGRRAEDLAAGEMLVVHHRKGKVIAVERHRP